MPEDKLPDDVRNALLKEVLTPEKKVETVSEVSETPKVRDVDPGKQTFEDLLEQCVEKREAFDKKDNNETDIIRKKVIESSRLDIIKDLKF